MYSAYFYCQFFVHINAYFYHFATFLLHIIPVSTYSSTIVSINYSNHFLFFFTTSLQCVNKFVEINLLINSLFKLQLDVCKNNNCFYFYVFCIYMHCYGRALMCLSLKHCVKITILKDNNTRVIYETTKNRLDYF
jgi:hypothetical protein